MDYDKYDRFFVMLEEQSEAFAMRQSTRSGGHIKIETSGGRGAMRIGVRNLKHFEDDEYIYKLILFGTAKEKTIYSIVGTVNVNRMGSGETYFRFDPSAMDKSGHQLADYSYAIVAAVSTKDETEPLHPVLKGVFDVPFYKKVEHENMKTIGEEAESAVSMEKTEAEEKAENIGTAERTGSTENIDNMKNTERAERACYNAYYNSYLAAQCLKINASKELYDRIIPFKDDITGAEWTKMSVFEDFPMVSPGGRALVEKYKHYIFGKSDGLYYLGVPGRFLREEQPEEGESGFTLWQPIIGAEEYDATSENASDEARKQAYGYWIIAIDAETGDILEA